MRHSMNQPRWYSQPLRPKAARVLLTVLGSGILLVETWFGRKRLIALEPGYIVLFVAFNLLIIFLFLVQKRVGTDARHARDRAKFERLRFRSSAVSGAGFAMTGLFSDYTLNHLTRNSALSAVLSGFVIGCLGFVSFSPPVFVDNEPQS
jgi:hypothetical protein